MPPGEPGLDPAAVAEIGGGAIAGDGDRHGDAVGTARVDGLFRELVRRGGLGVRRTGRGGRW